MPWAWKYYLGFFPNRSKLLLDTDAARVFRRCIEVSSEQDCRIKRGSRQSVPALLLVAMNANPPMAQVLSSTTGHGHGQDAGPSTWLICPLKASLGKTVALRQRRPRPWTLCPTFSEPQLRWPKSRVRPARTAPPTESTNYQLEV